MKKQPVISDWHFWKIISVRRTTLKELGESIERKKAELGYSGQDYVARNSGKYRTESKRALLRNIAAAAKARGEEPPFKANY